MYAHGGTSVDGRSTLHTPGQDTRQRQPEMDRPQQKLAGAVSGPSVIDLEGALKRLGGDRTLLAVLARVFAEDSPALLEKLKNAVASMQGEQIRSAAHALRGLAANFGSPSILRPLKELEEIGARDDLNHARMLLEEVCANTDKLKQSLDQHCQS